MALQKRSRTRRTAGAVLVLVGLFTSFFTIASQPAPAIPVPGGPLGNFEVDGNMADDPAPQFDWATATGVLTSTDVVNPDTGLQGKSKEGDPSGWVCNDGGGSPPKANLLRAYVNPRIYNGAPYVDVAFVRAASGGTSHVNFEFNANPTNPCTPNGLTGRAAGDLLLTFDFESSTTNVRAFTWDPALTADGDWVEDTSITTAMVSAATNDTAFQDVLAGNAPVGVRDFGEATINLAALFPTRFGANASTCTGFGQVNVRSRSSGQSWDSALQDRMTPINVNITNCGSAKLKKVDDLNVPMQGVVFNFTGQNTGATYQCTTDANGECTVAAMRPDTYAIVETTPSGYNPPGAIANITVVVGQQNVDHYNTPIQNAKKVGYLQIDKRVVKAGVPTGAPVDGAAFILYADKPGGNAGVYDAGEEITKWGGGVAQCTIAAAATSCLIGPVVPGSYRVHESAAPANSDPVPDFPFTVTESAAGNPNTTQVDDPENLVPQTYPDIRVVKTTPAATIGVGQTATYDIVVDNHGAANADGVSLSDTLPGGVAWSITAPIPGGCGITNGVLSCNFGTMAPGASQTVQVTGTPSTCTTLPNTATVSTTTAQAAGTAGDDSSGPVNIDVQRCSADMGITKSATNANINAGGLAEYTITVNSHGTATANGVTVTDNLPSGPSWSENSADCSINGSTLSCNFGDLAPGQSRSVTVSGIAPDCGTLSNTATVGTTSGDANNADNSAGPATIDVGGCAPDLGVVKTADKTSVGIGQAIGFGIVVDNHGSAVANNVVVTDNLPQGVTWTVDTNPGGACAINGGTMTCTFQALATGQSQTIHVSGTAPTGSCPTLTNTATVTPNDNQPADNTSTASITVTGCGGGGGNPPPVQPSTAPNARVVKTADSGTIAEGDTAAFTIVVQNTGDAAGSVTLSDPLPAGVTWTVDDTTHCSIAGGTLSCNFGSMAPASSFTVHVSGVAGDCGLLSNTATVAVSGDSNAADNTSTAQITVTCPGPAVRVVKSGPDMAHVGDTVTYTLNVTNIGDVPLTTVTVVDTRCDDTPVRTSGDAALDPAETWVYECSHLVGANDPDPLPNTASVVADDGHGNVVGDDDSHVVDVIHPAVTIDKTADPLTASGGDTVTYTYLVTNSGDVPLTDVVVTDDILGEIGVVPLLAPQETVTLTRSIVVGPGSAPRNVGTVNALDPLAKPVTASDDAFINIVLGETIEKTPPVVPVVAPAELPRTGGDFRGITLAGFILAGMGAILMLADRRLRSLYVTTSGTHVVGDVAEQRSDGLLARMGAGVVATMALIAVLFRRSGRR